MDIQNKNELQKLRADLLREKEQKEKEGVVTTTERSTKIEQTDGGQVTKEVTKTTEVLKAGGAPVTVSKTTSKTEVRRTAGAGKGGRISMPLRTLLMKHLHLYPKCA